MKKIHFKLYKAGKKWCIATIFGVATILGVLTNPVTANADDTQVTPETTATTQNSQPTPLTETAVTNEAPTTSPTIEQYTGTKTTDDGTYYYINGQQQKNKFLVENGKTFYFGEDGRQYQDKFYQNWGHQYYFNRDGSLAVKQFYQNWGRTYYFGEEGILYQDKFYQNWGHNYYFNRDGALAVKQFYQNWGNTYYFGEEGILYQNKFYRNWGHDYWFDQDGVLATSQLRNINGRTYAFNHDGILNDLQPLINQVNTLGSNIQIAIQSQPTGAIFSYNNAGNMRYHTASTIKVTVLAMLLHNTNGNLDATQYQLAKRMIENSDNDATTTIINRYLGGNRNLNRAFHDLGMTESLIDQHWGTTDTSATDQLKLLHHIFLNPRSNYLNPKSQAIIKQFMGNVNWAQRWGISAGRSNYYIKDGWNTSNGYWWVSSIGFIPQANNKGYSIAIYTYRNQLETAKNKIEQVARTVKSLLG